MIRFFVLLAMAIAPGGYRNEYAAAIIADCKQLGATCGPLAIAAAIFDVFFAALTERWFLLGESLRLATRGLARAPGFTIIAAGTLAVAIGANIAMFTVIDSVVLRPLPYGDSKKLVTVEAYNLRTGVRDQLSMSLPDADDIFRQSHTLVRGAAYLNGIAFTTLDFGRPRRIANALVSSSFFETLDVRPQLGRFFKPGDERTRSIVISDRFWRTAYGADPNVIGRLLRLPKSALQIIGVTAADFVSPLTYASPGFAPDVYIITTHALAPRATRLANVIARLAPTATPAIAQSELTVIASRLAREYPNSNRDVGFRVAPAIETISGPVRGLLALLFAGVLAVALIACANVGNMLLARAISREREIAIRLAIGATRLSIIRTFIVESAVLAFTGALAGLALAWVLVANLARIAPPSFPRRTDVAFSPDVLMFTAALVALIALVCGLIPGIAYGRLASADGLRDGAKGSTGKKGNRLRAAIVASEIALTLTLSVEAGLVLQSFARLTHVDTGFRTGGVAVFGGPEFPGDATPAGAAKRATFLRLFSERLRAVPGVDDVADVSTIPLSGGTMGTDILLANRPAVRPQDRPSAALVSVSPRFFPLLGVPFDRGRNFTDIDEQRADSVIVDEAFVQRAMHGGDPIGQRITTDVSDRHATRTIIGVVRNLRLNRLSVPSSGTVYFNGFHPYWIPTIILVHSHVSTAQLTTAVAAIDADIAPDIAPPAAIQTLTSVADADAADARFVATIFSALGVVAIAIALAGIYGVMSYDVARRTREIGIRMALGAPARTVLTDVLRRSLALTAAGILAGLVIAAACSRSVDALLFETTPLDPTIFLGASIAIALCTSIAAALPARRAARIDPMHALRFD